MQSAARDAGKPAVVGLGQTLSYGELESFAERFGGSLLGSGVLPGDFIAVLSRNCPEYAALHFGAARAGVIPAHISVRSTSEEVAAILTQTKARLLFHDDGSGILAQLACETVEHDVGRVFLAEGLARFLEMMRPDRDCPTLSPEDPLCITYSGGTTGAPKGVLVSHRSRCGMADIIAGSFGLSSRDVVCVVTPLFHVAGLLVWFQPAIAVAATCVLQHVWEPGELMQLAEEYQVSAVMMVPTQLIDLLNHPEFSPERLKSVVRIVHAGATMPPAILEQAQQTLPWIEFMENYGQSELGSVTVRRGADLPRKTGSVGRVIDGVEACVIAADGTPASAGVTGELCVRGPGTLLEYVGQPVETDALHRFGDGWVATGDLARIDEEGFVTLVDRTRNVIISGGTNIYPTEIENVIYQIPGIEECAVFAIPDPRLGEVPAAHVVCPSGAEMTRQGILDFCAARLSAFKVPQIVEMVEALPKSAVGKIRKNVLRDRYRT